MCARIGASPNSSWSSFPKRRIPVPPSKIRISFVSVRTSMQEVFPPKLIFSFWGVGVDPRTPQNRTRIKPPPGMRQYKRRVFKLQPLERILTYGLAFLPVLYSENAQD